jgi:DNA primase
VAAPFVELAVGERVVKLTNPDKVLFPGDRKTKLDFAALNLECARAAR